MPDKKINNGCLSDNADVVYEKIVKEKRAEKKISKKCHKKRNVRDYEIKPKYDYIFNNKNCNDINYDEINTDKSAIGPLKVSDLLDDNKVLNITKSHFSNSKKN